MKKIFIQSFLLFFLCITLFHSSSLATISESDLSFKGKLLSAKLSDISLKEIFNTLPQKIWLSGDEILFQEKVSARFTDLSFEDGLKRILASMNYSIVFNKKGEVIGVILVSKKSMDSSKKTSSGPEIFRMIQQKTPMEGFAKVDIDEFPGMKVIKNLPPPGGPIRISEEDQKHLEIIKDCPPPGGPVTMTPEDLKNLKVERNIPTPGDTPDQATKEMKMP